MECFDEMMMQSRHPEAADEIAFCTIYESSHLEPELWHENGKASSDNMNAEWAQSW